MSLEGVQCDFSTEFYVEVVLVGGLAKSGQNVKTRMSLARDLQSVHHRLDNRELIIMSCQFLFQTVHAALTSPPPTLSDMMIYTTQSLMLLLATIFPMCCLAWASPRIDPWSAAAHVGAVVSASAELREDVEYIGHGHGMLLLCGSRLCRELNVMREAFAGEAEDVEQTKLGSTLLRKPLNAVLKVLTSTALTCALALGGLMAALLEVFRDTRPGGHHGAVFFAMNELCELLAESGVAKGRLLKACENVKFRLFLLLNATLYALVETIGDVKLLGTPNLGAHHGVLWLAIAKTFRVIGALRSERKEYKEKEA